MVLLGLCYLNLFVTILYSDCLSRFIDTGIIIIFSAYTILHVITLLWYVHCSSMDGQSIWFSFLSFPFFFCTDCSACKALYAVSGTKLAHNKCKLLLLTNLTQIISAGAKIWAHFSLSPKPVLSFTVTSIALLFLLPCLSFRKSYSTYWVLRFPLNLRPVLTLWWIFSYVQCVTLNFWLQN